MPAITWHASPGAKEYEYEIAADPRFNSIVLGSGKGRGVARTHDLAAALDKNLADGAYYWRVRTIGASDKPSSWSVTRRVIKRWTTAPRLTRGNGAAVSWPNSPLVLEWSQVPDATKYIVTIATDPALSNIVLGTVAQPVKTQGTNFALPVSLDPGAYYWAITPLDSAGRPGARSALGTFTWTWNTAMTTNRTDLNPDAGSFDDPLFTWGAVPGAAAYEVEVNAAEGFPPGSRWFLGKAIGTAIAPTKVLANNRYYWRVRAIDAKGHTGVWNEGQPFTKQFDSAEPSIPSLTVRNVSGEALAGVPSTDTPIVTWDPVPGASRYEVQLTPHSVFGCDWSQVAADPSRYQAETATTAWTPLGEARHVGPTAWPLPQATQPLPTGTEYCLRVLARSDDDLQGDQVVSAWTQVNGFGAAAFTYVARSTETEQREATEENEEHEGIRPPCGANGKPTSYMGAWSETASYAKNSEVERDGARYISLTNENHKSDPVVSPAFWRHPFLTPGCAYVSLTGGPFTPRTPLLTWKHLPEASGYYVVIARDAAFTEVADVGFTNVPAYAPRLANEAPLSDETTAYYWAVIPTQDSDGVGAFSIPQQDSPQSFNKSSIHPTPLAPGNGTVVSTQPTFMWTEAENARGYRLQVSQDPTFGHPLEDVTTDATAYTAATTYPADTVLYWRVRGTDWNGQGLNWSPAQTFVRTLPAPGLVGIPAGGPGIPALTMSPVQGAIGYEMQTFEPDGKTKVFTFESPSTSIEKYYGTGVWRWQFRADFPAGIGTGKVAGAFSPTQSYYIDLPAPSGARGAKTGGQTLVSWNPAPFAKEYQVEIASSSGFSRRIESQRVEGTTWAPDIDPVKKSDRGTLYWRVAAVDWGGNVGTYTSGTFGLPPRPACKKPKGKKHATCARPRPRRAAKRH